MARKMNQPSIYRQGSATRTSLILIYSIISLLLPLFSAGVPPEKQVFSRHKTVTFGIMADVQYADKDSLNGRQYRESLAMLEECTTHLNQQKLSFTVQLGDLIDGQGKNQELTHRDLDRVLEITRRLKSPLYHVIGNHDLTADQGYLQKSLRLDSLYYKDFTIAGAPGWRFVILDGNDAGYGIMSETQTGWLRSTLQTAKGCNEKVVCFCHFPLLKQAARHHYMNKPEAVTKILDETGCVVAWFAGHDHQGGYAFRNGVHHITLKGMVESPPNNAFAVVKLTSRKIILKGRGKETKRTLNINRL